MPERKILMTVEVTVDEARIERYLRPAVEATGKTVSLEKAAGAIVMASLDMSAMMGALSQAGVTGYAVLDEGGGDA